MTVTIQEAQNRQIEEMKKHPLWEDFRKAYFEKMEIYPENSTVRIILIDRWYFFLAGVQAECKRHLESY